MFRSFLHQSAVAFFTMLCFSLFPAMGAKASPTPNVLLSGAMTGGFNTLKECFDAINATSGSGNLFITITANTTETSTASLNQNNFSIQIIPQGNRIVSCNLDAPLIRFSGADNVNLDGISLTGTNTLLLRNSNSGTNAQVLLLKDGANDNKLINCTIQSASSGTTGGAVLVGVSSVGANSRNLIGNNLFQPAGTGGLSRGIVFNVLDAGVSSTNDNNRVENNYFENVFSNSVSSAAIHLQGNTSNTLIKGNSFYNSTVFTNTVNGTVYSAVLVEQSGTPGSGVSIDSNFIGGSLPVCAGGYMTMNSAANLMLNDFISVSDGTGNLTSVTRNQISNISMEVANPTAVSSNAFRGIRFVSGNLQAMNGNMIGNTTNSSIQLVMHPASTAQIGGIGITVQGAMNTAISDNYVGGMLINASPISGATGTPFMICIDHRSAAVSNLRRNIVGGSSTGSITLTNTCPSLFNFLAIAFTNPADISTVSIDSNTVQNISASAITFQGIVHGNTTTTATSTRSGIGFNRVTDIQITGNGSSAFPIIYSVSAGVTALVQELNATSNTVSNINLSSGTDMRIEGMYIANSGSSPNRMKGSIRNNNISNLLNNSTGTSTLLRTRGIILFNDIVLGDSLVIASNTLAGIINAGSAIFTGSSSNSVGILSNMLYSSTNGRVIIRDNVLSNVSTTSIANAATRCTGISVTGNNAAIERNRMYGFQNANTAAGTGYIEGLLLRSLAGETSISLVSNNMMAFNSNTNARITGIRTGPNVTSSNLYHNSILLEGSGAYNSYCIYKAVGSTTDTRNNILYNARTGAGGGYAIGLETNASGYTGNNNYLVSSSAGTIAESGGNALTLSALQTAVGQEQASLTAVSGLNSNPANLFTAPVSAGLFINTSDATEPVKPSNNGQPLSNFVPGDFNLTIRNTLTPDIGAHEFSFTAPIPLRLLSFSVEKLQLQVLIRWSTANEFNASHFIVEYSNDGVLFFNACTIMANNRMWNSYQVVDSSYTQGIKERYYRLKMVDADGKSRYSSTVVIRHSGEGTISLLQNPARDHFIIRGLTGNAVVNLIQPDGKIVISKTISGITGRIDVSGLNCGYYRLRLDNGTGIYFFNVSVIH